jgi:putative membrane protein
MLIAGLVFAGLAALIHVYIFTLESLRFDQPSTWRVFGVRGPEEAAVLRPLMYNQGFYNLFLAIGTAAGIGLTSGGNHDAGLALVTFCCGSMLTAALVLAGSDSSKARGAIVQGTMPAIALLWLLLRVVVG